MGPCLPISPLRSLGSADEVFYIGADGEAAIESDESESDQFDNELDKNERAMSCE